MIQNNKCEYMYNMKVQICLILYGFQSSTPGPGAYGKGGIPSAALEEKKRMPVGTCPSMGHANKHRFETKTVVNIQIILYCHS